MNAPNILFVLADDMGAWAMGCAGNSEIRTPNLDRLAARGLRLTNAFCVSPVCSPARASLLTGRIPSQHGVHDWIRRGNSPGESPDRSVVDYLSNQPTVISILAAAGYACGLSGKWHLGNAITPAAGHSFWRVHARGGGPYYGAPMLRNEVEYTESHYVTDAITDNALAFLDDRPDEPPFYLGVHYTAPHSPWDRSQHPAEIFDFYRDHCPFHSAPDLPLHPWQINTAPVGGTREHRRENLSGYFAAITAMDTGISRLLDRLDADGLSENTLVVFTSDNGMNMGHHGIWGKGNGTYPQNMFDTSVKVPFLAALPGAIPPGIVHDGLFSHYDLLPTLLDITGLGACTPPGLPGTSHARLWLGNNPDVDAEIIVFDEYGPVQMIRTRAWKYVHRFPGGPNELYHLEDDPDENTNLIDSPSHQAVAADLRSRMEAWFLRHRDPAFDGRALPVTGRGQLDRVDSGQCNLFADDWRYLETRA